MTRLHVFALVTLLGASAAFAQPVPFQVSFTGNLSGSGLPVTGPHDFIFTLYDTSTGGTVAWTESKSALQVTNGLFFTALGSTTALSPTIFNGAPLYLEVSVDGVALSPRVPIQSVPYAVRAGVADSSRTLGTFLPSDLQQRVVGTCSGSNAIQSVATNGTVACVAIPTGGVSSVGAASPLSSSGGGTPTISIATASGSQAGALSAADWNAFNGKVTTVATVPPLATTGGPNPTLSLGTVGLAIGGTGANLSSTGGPGQLVKQLSAGGPLSVGALAATELPAHTHAATDLASGTIASARLSGAYGGITGIGTLAGLTVSGDIRFGAESSLPVASQGRLALGYVRAVWTGSSFVCAGVGLTPTCVRNGTGSYTITVSWPYTFVSAIGTSQGPHVVAVTGLGGSFFNYSTYTPSSGAAVDSTVLFLVIGTY